MRYILLLFILLHLSSDALAQCQNMDIIIYEENGECIGYDSLRHAYDIVYWNNAGDSLYGSSLFPSNDVEPTVRGEVERLSYSPDFRFEYTVSNGSSALQGIFSFFIETGMFHDKVTVPGPGWTTDSYIGLDWIYSVPVLDGLGRDHHGVSPDSTLGGFSYTSLRLPGIVNSFFSNAGGYGGWFDEGPTSKIRHVVDSLYFATEHVRIETVGPVVDPQSWSSVQIVDTLLTYPQRAFDLGWILTPSLVSDIDARLQSTRTALLAATELVDLLALLEAEKDTGLSSEAYAIFKYNAQYLLDQL